MPQKLEKSLYLRRHYQIVSWKVELYVFLRSEASVKYRSSIGQVLVNRQVYRPIGVSVDISVDTRPIYRPVLDRVSTDTLPSNRPISTDVSVEAPIRYMIRASFLATQYAKCSYGMAFILHILWSIWISEWRPKIVKRRNWERFGWFAQSDLDTEWVCTAWLVWIQHWAMLQVSKIEQP